MISASIVETTIYEFSLKYQAICPKEEILIYPFVNFPLKRSECETNVKVVALLFLFCLYALFLFSYSLYIEIKYFSSTFMV